MDALVRSLFLVALAGCATAGSRAKPRTPDASIAIVDVSVVDVEAGAARLHRTVLIADGRIVAVGHRDSVPVPDGSRRVDGSGRYLIPGLWDMHVHLSMAGRASLGVFPRLGVTTVRDMGGSAPVIPWRDSIAAGRLYGPRIVAAGTIIESERWVRLVTSAEAAPDSGFVAEVRSRFALATPEDAVAAVDSIVRSRADFAKIRNYPDGATFFALARALRRNGVPLIGHAPPIAALGMVSDSGLRGLEHSVLGSAGGVLREGFSTLAPADAGALMRRLARNGTAWTPTIVTGQARSIPDDTIGAWIADSLGRGNIRMRAVTPALRNTWREGLRMRRSDPDTTTDWASIEAASAKLPRAMRDAGVRILAGSDVGVTGIIPGWSLHDELARLVSDGGLTPAEALRSATSDAAAFVGLADRVGRVAPGFEADVLLLDANPLADIRATTALALVIMRGQVVESRSP